MYDLYRTWIQGVPGGAMKDLDFNPLRQPSEEKEPLARVLRHKSLKKESLARHTEGADGRGTWTVDAIRKWAGDVSSSGRKNGGGWNTQVFGMKDRSIPNKFAGVQWMGASELDRSRRTNCCTLSLIIFLSLACPPFRPPPLYLLSQTHTSDVGPVLHPPVLLGLTVTVHSIQCETIAAQCLPFCVSPVKGSLQIPIMAPQPRTAAS
ncbi:uncharacterized protein EI90DRAFT_659007 [Cantharellus anzutake]|uniref:uncharacterized protein n=1 Tax=Cantharellus anzutake TaxID=1750568 RepID=UPI0019081C4C|nr:uncharacterized protein EI90DRAFT_659007 [Cantharellus anzutake]KAF8312570.1 hypothetical protein EI90DRAFT_659007 [Cantharellus anzutake]